MHQNLNDLVRELASRRGLNPDTTDAHELAILTSLSTAVADAMDHIASIAIAHANGRAWLAVLLTSWAQQCLETPLCQPQSRRFHLQRDTDITGFSGPGHVADGVHFPDGTAVIHWRGDHASTVVWAAPNGIDKVKTVHGHDGATRIVWDD